MGRYQSPLIKHDLSRLEDPEARQIALTSLKSCVRHLEPDCISLFLDQISEAHQDASRPYVISLYEDISRVHRSLVVPYIPRMMESIVTALSESGSSPHVHSACARVVDSLSRYCIDVQHQAREVLRAICEPLVTVLVGKFVPVAAGAATCLQALVLSEAWKHAPGELVNEVCCRATQALSGKSMPTVPHIHLVCTLSSVNKEALSAYTLELLRGGGDILQAAAAWTLRVAAAQLLKCALELYHPDSSTASQELSNVIEVLERYRLDRMPKVRSAVGDALKTAKARYCTREQGIGSILLPRLERRPILSRSQGAEVEFVIVEEGSKQPKSLRRKGKSSDTVRHTVSAGPGGYVVQEWIKVEDGFPHSRVLAGIDEGDEYFEQQPVHEDPSYGQQFYSPLERHVVIFDEDHTATNACKRLIEETEAAIPSVSQSPPENTGDTVQDTADAEWSVRDNPIAGKDRSSTPPIPNKPEPVLSKETNGDTEPSEACEETGDKPLNVSEAAGTLGDKVNTNESDSTVSNDGSFDESKNNMSEEMVDTFRRSWEELETANGPEIVTRVPDSDLVNTSFRAESQRFIKTNRWKCVRYGVEGLLLLPFAVAVIKYLQPNLDVVPPT